MSHLRHRSLGGFILPILFCALLDLTGIRSSAFMPMCGVVGLSLAWMYRTGTRGTQLMENKARAFRRNG